MVERNENLIVFFFFFFWISMFVCFIWIKNNKEIKCVGQKKDYCQAVVNVWESILFISS